MAISAVMFNSDGVYAPVVKTAKPVGLTFLKKVSICMSHDVI